MFSATRRWLRRNRTPLAVGLGVLGAGYVATQFVLSKINDARERMSSDRIAKENLRRRFEQNQDDCSFTVLALLPTVTSKIIEAMDTEKITYEIQHMKAGGAKSIKSGSGGSASPPSIADTTMTDEDGRSMASMQSESGVHASRIAMPSPSAAGDGPQEGGQAAAQKRKTKRQLWDDLTISSVTRAYTLIYTLGLLTMFTRIQLNLLGRRNYLSSVVTLATGSAEAAISLENKDDDNMEQTLGNDFEVNRKYLTFSWWLLNQGWIGVMQRVEAAVRDVFGKFSPRDQLSFETFAQLTRQVRARIESGSGVAAGAATAPWLSFLLPPVGMEDSVLRESGILGDSAASLEMSGGDGPPPPPSSPTSAASLRRLLDETSDLVESPAFSEVLGLLLDAGFSVLLDGKVAPAAFDVPPPPSEGSPELSRLRTTKTVLLPKILSVLTRQAHVISADMPNEYLHEMDAVRELEAFAAVVYSSNWEMEIQNEGGAATAQAAPAPSSSVHDSSVRQSQVSATESLVVVDPSQSSFESAWEKALGQS